MTHYATVRPDKKEHGAASVGMLPRTGLWSKRTLRGQRRLRVGCP
ncbi:hypothetical protein [Nitrospira sp. BLG_1]